MTVYNLFSRHFLTYAINYYYYLFISFTIGINAQQILHDLENHKRRSSVNNHIIANIKNKALPCNSNNTSTQITKTNTSNNNQSNASISIAHSNATVAPLYDETEICIQIQNNIANINHTNYPYYAINIIKKQCL